MSATARPRNVTKAGLKARLALAGPAGSGKTYTALRVATACAIGADGRCDREMTT